MSYRSPNVARDAAPPALGVLRLGLSVLFAIGCGGGAASSDLGDGHTDDAAPAQGVFTGAADADLDAGPADASSLSAIAPGAYLLTATLSFASSVDAAIVAEARRVASRFTFILDDRGRVTLSGHGLLSGGAAVATDPGSLKLEGFFPLNELPAVSALACGNLRVVYSSITLRSTGNGLVGTATGSVPDTAGGNPILFEATLTGEVDRQGPHMELRPFGPGAFAPDAPIPPTRGLTVQFDEATAKYVSLFAKEAGGRSVELRPQDHVDRPVSYVTDQPFWPGNYRIEMSAIPTDLAGNPLVGDPLTFTVKIPTRAQDDFEDESERQMTEGAILTDQIPATSPFASIPAVRGRRSLVFLPRARSSPEGDRYTLLVPVTPTSTWLLVRARVIGKKAMELPSFGVFVGKVGGTGSTMPMRLEEPLTPIGSSGYFLGPELLVRQPVNYGGPDSEVLMEIRGPQGCGPLYAGVVVDDIHLTSIP
jgi:hypothetical protein